MKILLLEDDIHLSSLIKDELIKQGYHVDCAHDGEIGMLYALNIDYAYDLAIIDRMLPIIDGLSIIKAMRKKGILIPIIITTGLSTVEDRIEGLDGGADDYLVKPFYIEELLARIRALIRRPITLNTTSTVTYGDLTLDCSNRTITSNDNQITLTQKETLLLQTFLKNPNTLFSKEQLILKIWGTTSSISPGNIDNYISFLRKRLKELKSSCEIKTIYGAGYKLVIKHA